MKTTPRWLWLIRVDQMSAWCDHPDHTFREFPRSSLMCRPDSTRWQDFQAGHLPIIELLDAFGVTQRIVTIDLDDYRSIETLWGQASPWTPGEIVVNRPDYPRWARPADIDACIAEHLAVA